MVVCGLLLLLLLLLAVAFLALGSRSTAAVSLALQPPSTVFLDWDACLEAGASGRGRTTGGPCFVSRLTVCVAACLASPKSSSYFQMRIVCPAKPEGDGGSCRGCAAKSCFRAGPPGAL